MSAFRELADFPLDDELISMIKSVRNLRIKTLERLLASPEIASLELEQRNLGHGDSGVQEIRSQLSAKLELLVSYQKAGGVYFEEVMAYFELLKRKELKGSM